MPKTLKPGDLLEVKSVAAGMGLGAESLDVTILEKGAVVKYVRLGRLIVESAKGELLEVRADNLGSVNANEE